jgi:hypothetical protein
MTNANLPAGNSKEGKINVSFTEASISEEPSAVIPHAGICFNYSPPLKAFIYKAFKLPV